MVHAMPSKYSQANHTISGLLLKFAVTLAHVVFSGYFGIASGYKLGYFFKMTMKLTSSLLNGGIFLQSFCRSPWRLQGNYRTLFTAEALGIDVYQRQRDRADVQFTGMADKFRNKMKEFATEDSKNMIFTEDLKNILHLVNNQPEDLTLVHQMMRRFNQQNKHLRFGNFVFGPVVMRMYHFLNEPKAALEVFKDPELEGMFENITTAQVLCDLLYQNKMYQEVLDVFEMVQAKQAQGVKYPRNIIILATASCSQLNTPESYDYVLKLFKSLEESGAQPVRRSVAFAAELALKQNAPQVALEILSLVRTGNYVSIRNLKLWALSDLNRPDDAFPILRYSIENEDPDPKRKHTVCAEVMEKLDASVKRSGNKEFTLDLERIRKALVETNQITNDTIDSILNTQIEKQIFNERDNNRDRDRRGFERQQVDQSFRIGQSSSFRPSRNPAYDRERQSIRREY